MTDSFSKPEEVWAFDERESKECWKCGEPNPIKAVMCWACYAPLSGDQDMMARSQLPSRREHERQMRFEAGREQFFACLPFVGILVLIASGYSRKARLPLVGAGSLALAVHFARDFKIQRAGRAQPDEERTPIQSITDTILLYAVRDGASKIRLRAGVGIHVHYLIGDEWQEQMKIPGYVWNDLCVHLLEQSDGWKRPIVFQMDEKRFEFVPHFEHEFPLETLTLSLLA